MDELVNVLLVIDKIDTTPEGAGLRDMDQFLDII